MPLQCIQSHSVNQLYLALSLRGLSGSHFSVPLPRIVLCLSIAINIIHIVWAEKCNQLVGGVQRRTMWLVVYTTSMMGVYRCLCTWCGASLGVRERVTATHRSTSCGSHEECVLVLHKNQNCRPLWQQSR